MYYLQLIYFYFYILSGLMILRQTPHTGIGPPAFRSCSELRFLVWFGKFDGTSSVWLVRTLLPSLCGNVVPLYTTVYSQKFAETWPSHLYVVLPGALTGLLIIRSRAGFFSIKTLFKIHSFFFLAPEVQLLKKCENWGRIDLDLICHIIKPA